MLLKQPRAGPEVQGQRLQPALPQLPSGLRRGLQQPRQTRVLCLAPEAGAFGEEDARLDLGGSARQPHVVAPDMQQQNLHAQACAASASATTDLLMRIIQKPAVVESILEKHGPVLMEGGGAALEGWVGLLSLYSVPRSLQARLMTRHTELLLTTPSHEAHAVLALFQSLGIQDEVIRNKVFRDYPALLTLSVEAQVLPALETIRQQFIRCEHEQQLLRQQLQSLEQHGSFPSQDACDSSNLTVNSSSVTVNSSSGGEMLSSSSSMDSEGQAGLEGLAGAMQHHGQPHVHIHSSLSVSELGAQQGTPLEVFTHYPPSHTQQYNDGMSDYEHRLAGATSSISLPRSFHEGTDSHQLMEEETSSEINESGATPSGGFHSSQMPSLSASTRNAMWQLSHDLPPAERAFRALICNHPEFLLYCVDAQVRKELNEKVAFLRDQGLTQEDVGAIMLSCPSFFQADLKRTMVPKVTLLQKAGFTGPHLRTLLSRNPRVMTLSRRHLERTLRFLQMVVGATVEDVLQVPQVLTTSVYQVLGPALCYVHAACGRRNAGFPSLAPSTFASSSSSTSSTSVTSPGSLSTTGVTGTADLANSGTNSAGGMSSTGAPYSMEERSQQQQASPASQEAPSPAWAALCGSHGRLRLAVLLAVSRGSDLVLEKPPGLEVPVDERNGSRAAPEGSSSDVFEPVMGEDGQYVVDVYCERLPVWYRRTTYERVAQEWRAGPGKGWKDVSKKRAPTSASSSRAKQ